MAELIDLTLTLGSERISVVPGLAGVETSPLQTHESHARSNQRLCLATHIGTHVDAPYHFVPGAATIEEMPLEKYMGPALLLDLRSVARGLVPLEVSQLEAAGATPKALRDKIAVLFTGWAEAESGGPRFTVMGLTSATKGPNSWPTPVSMPWRWTFPSTSFRRRPSRPFTTFRYTACCWDGTSPSSKT